MDGTGLAARGVARAAQRSHLVDLAHVGALQLAPFAGVGRAGLDALLLLAAAAAVGGQRCAGGACVGPGSFPRRWGGINWLGIRLEAAAGAVAAAERSEELLRRPSGFVCRADRSAEVSGHDARNLRRKKCMWESFGKTAARRCACKPPRQAEDFDF